MNDAFGERPGSVPQWREHRSPHFLFRFLPGSPAERDVTLVASRLEAFRNATIQALDLKDVPPAQVHVYLSDMPEGDPVGGSPASVRSIREAAPPPHVRSDEGTGADEAASVTQSVSPDWAGLTQAVPLVWLEDGAGERWYLESETRIGRGELCEVRIPDPRVSREHAEVIRRSDDSYWISDLGSTNGTFVNDDLIEEPR